MRIIITPAIMVASSKPVTPCASTMPNTTTMKALAGPAIWTLEPPSSATTKPPTIAAHKPDEGGKPEAMAMAMAKGRATMPTVTPAPKSLLKVAQW
jgi:hypothetical protein